MPDQVNEARQLYLFEVQPTGKILDPGRWHGSFSARESSLQQLSPYIGKLKSGMVKELIRLYSQPGETILDPFCGSGVVPLEALLSGRHAMAIDLSPYAYTITRGKLEAPGNEREAINKVNSLIQEVELDKDKVDISSVPEWVQNFFHPATLREIVTAFKILRESQDYFLTACLLGILHHIRPGFLSFPASHLVPYLRKEKFPPEKFPKMYEYRDLRSRLSAKVKRAYKRPMLPIDWEKRDYQIWQTNAMNLPIGNECVDTIISSPPYFGALDYARDNRLRLWFLGCNNWKTLDASLTAKTKVYLPQMSVCLGELFRVLKPKGKCVLVLGDVDRDGKLMRTAEILADEAAKITGNDFKVEGIYDDRIPDERRSRRNTKTTKFERILVMHKT